MVRRPVQGLDARPSDAELLRMAEERNAKRRLSASGTVTVTKRAIARAKPGAFVTFAQKALAGLAPVLGLHSRYGDELRLVLNLAPRTKKNGGKGGFAGIKQRPAYRRYRDAIVAALAPLRVGYGVPILPNGQYNIRALYYVDRGGEQADKCGLDQGLYDALENAGVVSDDWQFRSDDGTRIVIGDREPRVEVLITPITEDRCPRI